ncbi:DNA-deoxyinosine glycosylase [Helicobacter sp. MIT 14-3879]|uniref:DNA-deoxyinosine glycosylase n=1 Tax=Helicobacter sp. MIT 14-3879 TaxID=2040649 RepID=UPI000E1F2556|nr:DNA-deoxyinosine glycosylase [Helicobacter sp. MIT 14-3879]RDU64862.1 DNA-deoxyinosine glycosylase [Helicobacter sp. MIT 14-3879]
MGDKRLIHPFLPIYDNNSKILILGSFPSVISRNVEFYYGNPKNRFWNILEEIFCYSKLLTIESKTLFLLTNKIALWDIIYKCEILDSKDDSLKNITPNNLEPILPNIKAIFCNGIISNKILIRFYPHLTKQYFIDIFTLPSSSSANARYKLKDLVVKWSIIKQYLD